jgi:tetratricopeptide (TPR) repeat protein
MAPNRFVEQPRLIGATLLRWREERGLSLMRVEDAARESHESINQDYLSRLERGLLMPSIPKVSALAAIYQRPVTDLIDLCDVAEFRRFVPRRASSEKLRRVAKEHLEEGEVEKAFACFMAAIETAKEEGKTGDALALVYQDAGSSLLEGRRYLTARQYIEEGLKLSEEPSTFARLLIDLALVQRRLGAAVISEVLTREAMRVATAEPSLRAEALTVNATCLMDAGRFADAEANLLEARKLCEKARNARCVNQAQLELGRCLILQGKIEGGLEMLRTAAAGAFKRRDRALQAASLSLLGRTLAKAGRTDEARAPLAEALPLAVSLDDHESAFYAAFHLWKAGPPEGNPEERRLFGTAIRHRQNLDARDDEIDEFDRLRKVTKRYYRPRVRKPKTK